MKKSKILIIIAASVLAAAIVVVGIIFALTKAFTFVPADSSSDISESSVITDNSSNPSNEESSMPVGNESSETDSATESSSATESNDESTDSKPVSSEQASSDTSSESVTPSDCTITAGTAFGAKGKIVKVPVSISANPGIMAMIFDIEYDSSLLKYSGYSEGNVLNDYEFSEGEGKVTFLNVEQNNITKNGNLFFVEFEILSDKAQDCEIKLTVKNDSFCNYDEQLINVQTKNGKVTIK